MLFKQGANSDQRESSNKLTFSTPYSTDFNKIKHIFNKFLPVLYKDEKLRNILDEGCRCVARKGKTLGNYLSPSDVNNYEEKKKTWLFKPGFFPCFGKLCNVCKYAEKRTTFVSSRTDSKNYDIRDFINCNSTYVVYNIVCRSCNLIYVGCTKRKLKTRIAEHVADILHCRTNVSGAAKHFLEKHSGSLEFFSFYAI